MSSETLFETPRVANPAWPRPTASQNRVMRESWGDPGREAFTGSQQAMESSPEMVFYSRVDTVQRLEGNIADSIRSGNLRPRRDRGPGHADSGFPGNPGDLVAPA